jgi:hypothetical protein
MVLTRCAMNDPLLIIGQYLANMNPYHDKEGKFASVGGGSNVSRAEAEEEAAFEKLEEARRSKDKVRILKEMDRWREKVDATREARDLEKEAAGRVPDEKLPIVDPKTMGLVASRDNAEHKAALASSKAMATAVQKEDIRGWTHKTTRGIPLEVGRIRDAEASGRLTDQARSFNKTLDAMPVFNGTVYRGVKIDEMSQGFKDLKKVGAVVKFASSSSATKSPVKASTYGNVLMKIKSKSGADISHLEIVKNSEVVMRRGTTYMVSRVHNTVRMRLGGEEEYSRYTVVELEEQ